MSFMKNLWRGTQLVDEEVEVEREYERTVVVPICNVVMATIAVAYAYTLIERTLPHEYFLSMYVFYGISWLFIPHLIVRFYAAKDFEGVIVGGIGTYVSLFVAVTISPLLIGLSLIALYGLDLPEVEVVEGLVPLLF